MVIGVFLDTSLQVQRSIYFEIWIMPRLDKFYNADKIMADNEMENVSA
jgi:hypothetical protein